MRLKQLELQGYKTFADKTQFVFNGGLTAIIGPNGSGKSNVADAVQWVLGEQSHALLRAKRSEDMIFSGSNERSRMGMAQASLTLDNSDGWLPVDYGEVEISRRAYRSGENEYYLNGAKVRLRDVADLLGHSGLSKRTYTVIGQGLIDQALSLRPSERRALLEEAAGIAGHQAKRDRALSQLEETRRNLERVQDILQEIEPRLRYLKGQARRAEERMQVQADLDALLRIWYGYRWRQALEALQEARQQEGEARALVETRRDILGRLMERDAGLRQRHSDLRNQLGDWHRESSKLHRQAEGVQRELAVGSERLRQLSERREDLLRELQPLQERQESQARQAEAAQAALAAEQASLQAIQAEIQQAQARLDQVEAERLRRQTRLSAAQQQVAILQREIAAQERHLLERDSRQRALVEEHQRLEAVLATALAGQADLAPQIASQQARLDELQAAGQALAAERQALLQAIAQSEAELAAQADELARQRRQADRLQDQFDLLQRLKDEGEGYSGGSRSIVRAAGSAGNSGLSGIIGTVADQLQVPAKLELAIETALGGRLQDVIVERWEDAERAIDWLKRTRGGRATFLPLDTIRAGQPIRPPALPGVVGLASDLVRVAPRSDSGAGKADSRLNDVLNYLLGRVIITKDLPTARRVLDSGRERPTVVTLDGDIVRPGGSVSGGSQASHRDQGVLARERALRELPQQLGEARQLVAELEAARTELGSVQQEQRRQLAHLDRRLADMARQQQAESAALARLQGRASQMAEELRGRQARLEAADQDKVRLREQAETAQQRLADLARQIAAAEQAMAGAEAALGELDTRSLAGELLERRTSASTVEARVGSQQEIAANQQRALSQLQREIRSKQERAEALASERAALEARLQELQAGDAELSGQIEAFARRIDPAEAELVALEAERSKLAEEEANHRQQLQRQEQVHQQAQLALQRARDELAHLRSEIEHDVGLVELEQHEALTDQPPLPLRPLVERLPLVAALPENIERDVRELRAQYSRLGSVNPNAPEEYAAAQERFEFLTTQSRDLEEAAGTLEKVIAELNEVMLREFMKTFRSVAREFKEQFTSLFGGGTARLELSEPDDPMNSGVEIIVRPPGKRTQPLPLLSGGERSLTAAALILSILKVSPPPFCILDEVDAALDESNVERFKAALREAAINTQFIVITHNRGTIEAADTIYGISMGSDSVSQALSLQLDELE